MTHISYKIVRHEDGWAYTVNGAFSESFPTHAEALEAARRAAAEQRQPGNTEAIEYEDESGKWHLRSRSAATGRIPTSRIAPRENAFRTWCCENCPGSNPGQLLFVRRRYHQRYLWQR